MAVVGVVGWGDDSCKSDVGKQMAPLSFTCYMD